MQSTMQDFPLTIAAILRHATTVHGDRTVTTATGDGFRHTTYREIGADTARLANALRRLGIAGDQRVATFMWNNQEHLTVYLAAPSMGAVLHTLNIRLSAEQIAFIANEAQDQVVFVDMSLAAQLAAVLPSLETVHTVIAVGDGDVAALVESGKTVLRYADLLSRESADFDWPALDENSAAAMCYTSGTTGNPKGVVYSHRSSYLHSMATNVVNGFGIGFGDSVLPIVPMFHANAWGLPYGTMMAGADLVLPDRFMDAKSLIQLIETQRPTVAGAVPTIWNDVMNCLEKDPGRDISSLRMVACGGSAVPVSLMQTFEERHGVQIRQLWGMTETSPLATLAWPPPNVPREQQWALRATQGRPVCGVEARIVDDQGAVLPSDGESVGELEVRGPWITGSYYLGRDEAKFADGWLRTGDVGRIDALGYVTLTDRAKDVIKSGGEWISSVELENHLVAHPAVLEAAVVGVPDERWQERPLAAVVIKDGADVTAQELREFLADRVVRWWLPERWTFVDEVPRTSVGKYDKKTIRARHADNAYEVTEVRD
ncbi:long-chain fatty acid--CoA ligase [Mycolicibacterium komossense]|uniref:Long-chain fatty acid--CoA ligase n=1 Tax=Mycolicibacterium komossense TaxID=1779 RepID=A0ABT3C545_9MYCO|nr:long-chain fatty acid--CoA ligase [Mycolicibacterium komossense]MCV7224598.1 long-chain fatty acid--CoA ligase [Mycolicibacterium komossense]